MTEVAQTITGPQVTVRLFANRMDAVCAVNKQHYDHDETQASFDEATGDGFNFFKHRALSMKSVALRHGVDIEGRHPLQASESVREALSLMAEAATAPIVDALKSMSQDATAAIKLREDVDDLGAVGERSLDYALYHIRLLTKRVEELERHAPDFSCCGGNDARPPDHCTDCPDLSGDEPPQSGNLDRRVQAAVNLSKVSRELREAGTLLHIVSVESESHLASLRRAEEKLDVYRKVLESYARLGSQDAIKVLARGLERL